MSSPRHEGSLVKKIQNRNNLGFVIEDCDKKSPEKNVAITNVDDDNIDRLQDTKIVEDRPVPTVASSLATPAAPSQTPTHNSTPQPLLTPITQVPPSPASTGTTPVAEKRGRGRPKKVVDPNAPPPPPKIPKVKRTPKTPRTPKEPKTPKTPRAKDVLENSIIVPNNIESSFKSMDSPSQNFEQTKPDD